MKKETIIKQRMDEMELSVSAGADALGISYIHMSFLRSGRRKPSPELAKRISVLWDLPFEDVLFGVAS